MKQTKQFLRPLLMAIVMMVGMLVPKGAWAQSPVTVGDQEFSTIQDAIDYIVYGAKFDATLTLHQDFTLEDDESIDINFESGSEYFNITIDLNGHTITGGCEGDTNGIIFYNMESGLPTVTIANSCQDKKGKLFNCCLHLSQNTQVIVNEGVSIYPRFELVEFQVVDIEPETSLVNNGDIYGVVMVNSGSFINKGRVAHVNGEFVNEGSYCAYFNWADDGSSFSAYVNNLFYDYNEGDESASITSVVTKEPTCTEPGLRTVTGTVFYGGQEFTDTKEVEIPAGHDYQVQNVVWSEDYTSATLQLVCSRDAEHTANVEVTGEGITWEDTTPATCVPGVRTYTATATYEGVEYTGTKEVEISATGHDWADDHHTYCNECGHSFIRYTTTGEEIFSNLEENEGLVAKVFDSETSSGYLEFDHQLNVISEDAFYNQPLSTVILSWGTNTIGRKAFQDCASLTSITGAWINSIQASAFLGCTSLASVSMPNLLEIKENAFQSCEGLESIDFPLVERVGNGAFYECTGLSTVSLPKAERIDPSAFDGCTNLTKLSVKCYVNRHEGFEGVPEDKIIRIHTGDEITIPEQPATCTEAGYEAYSYCALCEDYVDPVEIPALGHTSVTNEAVPATCTESGRTEGSHCSVCGDVLVLQEEIPALGHTPVTDEAVDATCTTAGLTEGTHCSVCDEVLVCQEEVPALGHAFGNKKTLCDDGYYHPVCTREECDVLSEDKYAKMFGDYKLVTSDENPTATIPMTKVGKYYYTSLYTDFPYTMSEDVEAWVVSELMSGQVKLSQIEGPVPAGTGVILRSETESKCTITYDAAGAYLEDRGERLLTGSETEVTEPAANQYAFGLSDTGYLGFWHWPDMEIPAWKAYLDLGSETATEARGFRIVFDDETNGIQQLPADASAIEGSYDLMGHKVREVKGLGIVNGKKVFVNY